MPTYTFEDKQTGERHEKFMTLSKRKSYLKENPNLSVVIAYAPALVGGVQVKDKTDSGWKENLSRIADAHPASELAKAHGRKDPKSVKKREITEKWKQKTGGVDAV